MRLCFSILCLTIFFWSPALSQEEIEDLFEETSEDSPFNPELDAYEYYLDFRIDLRTANADDLSQLPGISYLTALRIIDLVQTGVFDKFQPVIDSLQLTGLQEEILRECTYLNDEKEPRKKAPMLVSRSRAIRQLTLPKGFDDGSYAGSPLDVYQRLSWNSAGLDAGLLTSKDAGESSFTDFFSAYLNFDLSFANIILGDFYVESGMGSLLWRPFARRKGVDVISPALVKGRGIRPYRSAIESDYLRGAGVSKQFNIGNIQVDATAWASSANRSATIDSAESIVTSIYNSGLFRTETEISKKNNLNEKNLGASLEIGSGAFSFGGTGFLLEYEKPVESASSAVFSGKSGFMSSLFAYYSAGGTMAGGEIARDANGLVAYNLGFQHSSDAYEAAIHYRNFASRFRSPFGFNTGENSFPANESGLYAAFLLKSLDRVRISSYIDIYKTHSPTYYVPVPVRGIDLFSEARIRLENKTKAFLRLRYEKKTDAIRNYDKNKYDIYRKGRYSLRMSFNRDISRNFWLRIRGEYCYVASEGIVPDETGFICFCGIKWQLIPSLGLGGRLSYFSTDSYNSAIWQYEYAMAGYMNSVPLYGRGTRFFCYLRYRPMRMIAVLLRYASTTMNNRDHFGTGAGKIPGPTRSVLYAQLELRI